MRKSLVMSLDVPHSDALGPLTTLSDLRVFYEEAIKAGAPWNTPVDNMIIGGPACVLALSIQWRV